MKIMNGNDKRKAVEESNRQVLNEPGHVGTIHDHIKAVYMWDNIAKTTVEYTKATDHDEYVDLEYAPEIGPPCDWHDYDEDAGGDLCYSQKSEKQQLYDDRLYKCLQDISKMSGNACMIKVLPVVYANNGQNDWDEYDASSYERRQDNPEEIHKVWHITWESLDSAGDHYEESRKTGEFFYTKLDAIEWIWNLAKADKLWETREEVLFQ
jgi:hypothetical protein